MKEGIVKFHNLKNKTPAFGEQIQYVKVTDSFGLVYYEILAATVEYQWDNKWGTSIIYDPKDPSAPEPDIDEKTGENLPYQLIIFFGDDSYFEGDNVWWIGAEELEEALNI